MTSQKEKEQKELIIKSILESQEISTMDKYILIANFSIVVELISQTLGFVEWLFELMKKGVEEK